jgi:hypothetical protein
MKQIAQKSTTTIIALIVVVGLASFFGGMKFEAYKSAKNRSFMMGQFQGQRPGGSGQFAAGRSGNRIQNGARPVSGEILSNDEKSITVKMMDGSSKIVILSEKTSINKAAEATKADLIAGSRINVFGTENTDGSVTAANIQLNPMLRVSDTQVEK